MGVRCDLDDVTSAILPRGWEFLQIGEPSHYVTFSGFVVCSSIIVNRSIT
jgi:hypothetical protein